MNKPSVSIITPSLNRANFIELNIKSIMNQSYKNFEHIIVDGGSTDGTIEILKKYEKEYNLKWISEPDNGMYDAINKGIKMAKGDIIAYLNTDDLYFPWTLEVVCNNFHKTNVDIIFGDCLVLQNSLFRIFLHPSNFNYKRLACYYGLSLPQPSTFIKRKVFDELGYLDIDYKLFGDIEFWVRCGFYGCKFYKVREILSLVIFHDTNLHMNKKLGYTEKNKIKGKYCDNESSESFIKSFVKYADQVNVRIELLRFIFSFLIKDNNWYYFKNFVDEVHLLKVLIYELLPNRYKFMVKGNYIFSKNLLKMVEIKE